MGSLLFISFPGSPCSQIIMLQVFHTLQPSWIFLSHQLPKLMSREWAYLRHSILCYSSSSFRSRNGSKDECAMLGLASFPSSPSFLGVGTKGVVSPESESDELLLSSESISMIALLAASPSGTSLLSFSLQVSYRWTHLPLEHCLAGHFHLAPEHYHQIPHHPSDQTHFCWPHCPIRYLTDCHVDCWSPHFHGHLHHSLSDDYMRSWSWTTPSSAGGVSE